MFVKLSFCHVDVRLDAITIHLVADDLNSISNKSYATISIAPFMPLE
jgi:hypothetical protein